MKPNFPLLFECLDSETCTSLDNNILNAFGVFSDRFPFLKVATTPTNIICPGCEEYCSNMPIKKNEGRAYIACDKPQQYGKILLDNEDYQSWRLDLAGLAEFLSDALSGNVTEIAADRMYDIGMFSGRAVFLVKGIMWKDAKDLCKRACNINQILITLSPPPEWLASPSLWIAQLLMFKDGLITANMERLATILPGFTGGAAGTNSYRRGGKIRHQKTTDIKNNVIKPMFLRKRHGSETAKVSTIANSIIKELSLLDGQNDNSSKVQGFMNKYSIKYSRHIQSTIEYLQKYNDGGQISEWCYQISKGKL